MRILLVSPIPPAPDAPGAIGRVIDAQLEGLSERNDVTVVTVAGPEEFDLQALERLRERGALVHAVSRREPRGAQLWARRGSLVGRWLRGTQPWRTVWFWERSLQALIDEVLRGAPYDVVAVEDNAMGAYRYPEALPAVLTEHEVRRPRPRAWPGGSPTELARALVAEEDWRRWRGYQRATWRRFELVQAFTDRDAAAIAELAPELIGRLRVNPFGVVLPSPLPPAEAGSRELVFLGNFSHAPNVDAALWLAREILPRLRACEPAAHLTLVGPWPPAEVRALAGSEIEVTGYVKDATVYLERAALAVAPLRIGGGMRMKVLEAFALGKALVATPRALQGFPSRPEPYAAVAEDGEEIARAAARLLGDPREREELARRARRLVEETFSAAAYARRLEGVYAEAVGRHRSRRGAR